MDIILIPFVEFQDSSADALQEVANWVRLLELRLDSSV
jgi:hypothetical protein